VVEQVGYRAAADKKSSAALRIRIEEICPGEVATPPGAAPCGVLARRAAPILQHFSAMLGPPLEPSLTLLPVFDSGESGLGYSAPGMLLLSDWAARFAGAREYAPGFLAHEIAHQWFPCGVAPASSADGWLAESLAEYLAWRYLLEADPEAAREMVAEAMRDGVAYTPAWPLSLGLRLLGEPWSTARANLYQRGMLVFRTLETAIDRERVDLALAKFYKRYEGKSASIADFRAVCEEVAGRKLDWFFDYFIQGTEIPTVELRRLPSESPGVVAGEIVVKDFPPEGSVRVEMAIRTAQGIVEHSVATRGAVTPFSVNVPAPALGITLDPDQRILRWTEAAERSKTQTAILGPLPAHLIRKDLPPAIELVRRALAADPDDVSGRAQSLHEQLGELEREHEEFHSALADFEAAINGHSLSPFDTYLCRAKAYLFHGELQIQEGHSQEALEDALAGLALPPFVLMEHFRAGTARESSTLTLQQALESLRDSVSRR
jgi:tetratricopeptide (TPR) repeat protein